MFPRFSPRAWSALAASLALAGCALAPVQQLPEAPIPAQWPGQAAAEAVAPSAAATLDWQTFITDGRLRQLTALALEHNRDLRQTLGNVEAARALYRVERAGRLPGIDVQGSAVRQRLPGDLGGTGQAAVQSSYQAGVGLAAFELDLFGRVRNLSRAAQERYFASEEAQRSTRISLIAEIATAWLTLASDQDQLALAQDTLKAFAQTLDLTRAQFRIGVASELEARQAETNYQSARNDIATLQTRIAQDRNALNLLAGTAIPADQLPAGLYQGQVTLDALPGDLSSQLLLRRPDVLQAEHQLIAENANIGAARAAFFPRISLTATIGTISTALSGLFAGGSFTYTGAPSATLPLFDAGRNAGNLAYARASQQAAVATYEKSIQTAFREVADALATRGTIGEQIAAQTARVEAAQVAARLSDARYRAGIDSFLTALDAERTAYAARQQLQTTRLARASNLVELYRAFGGGLD